MRQQSVGRYQTILAAYALIALAITAECYVCQTSTLEVSIHPDQFASPGFPFGYPNNMDCSWKLQAPAGYQVEIIFIDVLTESCCDIIELRDGNSSSAGLLYTYRGNATESMYVSSFGSLYINFKSDDSHVYYGFFAEYKIATIKSECGGFQFASADNQSLASPGWPEEYGNNLHCTWTIQAPAGKRISIAFSFVETESCCDFILVRFGDSMNSKLRELGGTIDRELLPKYISTGDKIQVVFRSDRSMAKKGFHATFRAIDNDDLDNNLPCSGRSNGECGAEFCVAVHRHQSFTTPQYPLKHANDLDCVWILTAPKNARIVLWFTSVDTEECCDFIKIRDGELKTSRKIGVISGRDVMYPSFVSTKNKMRVHFQSDPSNTYRGFRAVFEAVRGLNKETCGGVRHASPRIRRYISTPNWPLTPPAAKCIWNITAPVGSSIAFHVIGFKSEKNREELLFYDMRSRWQPFAVMNSRSQTSRFTSSSNYMVVVFHVDFTSLEGGFRGFYKATSKRRRAR